MITTEAAASILRMLAAHYPNTRLSEDTVEVLTGHMTSGRWDLDTMLAAVSDWCAHESRFPTWADMLDGYTREHQHGVDRARDREIAAAQQRGMLLPGQPLPPSEYGIEVLDVLREVLGGMPPAKHVHRPGVDPATTCPTCARSDEIAASAAAQVSQLLDRRAVPRPIEPLATYACAECHDLTFVLNEANAAYPCPACNPIGHQRWLDGHLVPGHQCKECDGIRKGRRVIETSSRAAR